MSALWNVTGAVPSARAQSPRSAVLRRKVSYLVGEVSRITESAGRLGKRNDMGETFDPERVPQLLAELGIQNWCKGSHRKPRSASQGIK